VWGERCALGNFFFPRQSTASLAVVRTNGKNRLVCGEPACPSIFQTLNLLWSDWPADPAQAATAIAATSIITIINLNHGYKSQWDYIEDSEECEQAWKLYMINYIYKLNTVIGVILHITVEDSEMRTSVGDITIKNCIAGFARGKRNFVLLTLNP